MQKAIWLFVIFIVVFDFFVVGQNELPNISVKNSNNQIIISWVNKYAKPISAINIQRSFDSLRNFTTIGSVLNPLNSENGYSDENPPYNKMYYRLFIVFEGGTYIFTKVFRPTKDGAFTNLPYDSLHPFKVSPDWLAVDYAELYRKNKSAYLNNPGWTNPTGKDIVYPSQRIFTAKDNNINIYLPDAAVKKYRVKFFDENNKPVFELNKLHDSYFILEKVNFLHGGWFHFELYEEDKLIEKNKFFISKDLK